MQKTLHSRATVRMMTCIAMNVALLAVCAWISVPAVVSFTMQTFAVLLVAALFDWKISVSSVMVYILVGCCGAPVFSNFNGGPMAIVGPTGGYLIGFIFSALIISLSIRFFGKKLPVLLISMLLAIVTYYVFGTVWFCVQSMITGSGKTLMTALSFCVFPFIVPDLIKMALAILLFKRLDPLVSKIK